MHQPGAGRCSGAHFLRPRGVVPQCQTKTTRLQPRRRAAAAGLHTRRTVHQPAASRPDGRPSLSLPSHQPDCTACQTLQRHQLINTSLHQHATETNPAPINTSRHRDETCSDQHLTAPDSYIPAAINNSGHRTTP